MAESRLLIAHISDLHLAQRPNLVGFHHAYLQLSLICKFLNDRKKTGRDITAWTGSYEEHYANALASELSAGNIHRPADVVLVTGDVATVGRLDDMTAAKYWLLGRNGASVRFPMDRLVLMPGNHDRFHPALPLLSGSTAFEDPRAFGPRWDGSAAPRHHAKKIIERRFKVADTGISIICIDCSLSNDESKHLLPLKHFDAGVVRDDALKELSIVTQNAYRDNHAVVWAVHYPPAFPNHWWARLKNHRSLIDLATKLDVNYIFSGHTHKQIRYDIIHNRRRVTILCAGSATCGNEKEPPTYMHHTLRILNTQVTHIRTIEMKYQTRALSGSLSGKFYASIPKRKH